MIAYNDKGKSVINAYPDTGILNPLSDYNIVEKVIHFSFLGLSTLFGDVWWTELINLMKDTFNWVIQTLRDFWDKYKDDISKWLLIGGVVLVGGLLTYDYADEKIRQRARNS